MTHISYLNFVVGQTVEKSYSVFPNPSNGDFKIKLKKVASGNMVLYDFIGQVVYEFEFKETRDLKILLPENLVGLFSLRLKMDEQIYTETILIEE